MGILIGYKRLLMASIHLLLMVLSLMMMRLLFRPQHRAFRTCQRFFARRLLHSFNIHFNCQGQRDPNARLLVANHISWLDALLILSDHDVSFIAKQEVRQWPLIGFITHALGTLYIRRDNKFCVYRDLPVAQACLKQGKTLAIFPEGTTTKGADVLPFYPMLFEIAIREKCSVQPLALRYWNHEYDLSQAAPFVDDDSILISLKRIAFAPITHAQLFMLPAIHTHNVHRQQLARVCQQQIQQRLHHTHIVYPDQLQISLN